MEKSKQKYMTVLELVMAALSRVHEDTLGQDALEACNLDYSSVPSAIEQEPVECCSFDTIGYAQYGSNEGIYGTIQFRGKWKHAYEGTDCPWGWEAEVLVLKTLGTSKEAYLAMSQLTALICYHLDQYVKENLNRFD